MNNQEELIPMRPGELLRSERERAGISLERVAGLSKIKPGLLAAIENDDTADIPTVYLRGYIRGYARALGLNPLDVERRLSEVGGSEPIVQSVFSVKSGHGRSEKWLKASSYVAASAVIAALAWQFTHEAVRFSQGESELAKTTVSTPESSDSGAETTAARTRPVNTHLNASLASVEVLQQRAEPGGNTAAEQAWAALEGSDDATAAAPGEHHLMVSTSADSWVEILDGEGKQLELDLIRAGHERSYSGPMPLRVMLGRASAVQMTLDGESVDLAPYTRGDVARLTLDAAEPADGQAPSDSVNR